MFRGQDGGAPGTERRSRAAFECWPRAGPWRWSPRQRLGESEPSVVWDCWRCERRGAGERLASGPQLAAERRVPGGDTWTPQEREEALGGRCRVAAGVRPARGDSGRLLGCVGVSDAGRSGVPMVIFQERRMGRASRKHGPQWGPGAGTWSRRLRPLPVDAPGCPGRPLLCLFAATWDGGEIFPGELVCFPSPSRRPRHPRGLGGVGVGAAVHVGAGRACPRGSGPGLPGISCPRRSRAAGNWVCLGRSRHLRLGLRAPGLGEDRGFYSQLCPEPWNFILLCFFLSFLLFLLGSAAPLDSRW